MANNDSRITNNVRYPALDALLLFFLLNLVLQPLVEPDFGWHLRTGLDLLRNGWRLPETDPYSHTMPDWPWVEHAWLTDALIGLFYTGMGPLGVILFFAAVTVGAFFVAAGPGRAGRTHKLLAISGALWTALPFLGARTQLVTLLGLATVLWACDRYLARRVAHLWLLPPLFLLWANLHGGFTAGLFALTLVLLITIATRLAVSRWASLADRLDEPTLAWPHIGHLALVIGLCVLVTLLNPYGWRLYGEILMSLSDRFMIATLHEWQPVSLQSRTGVSYLGYLAALGFALLLLYRRIEPVRWTVLAVFLGLSLSGLAPAEFFRGTEYPIEAVQWIHEHRDKLGTRLYNDYDLGGFLHWWLPGEKIFIDGRMPAWRIGNRRIYYDYLALTNWDPPALGVLQKYGVDWALVERGSPLAQALASLDEWREVYADTKVSIYVKRGT
ncbi:MAG: hypothetical protein E6K61_03895 [Nitrospirae bacterium]|nr:MAG: hypothetical protein E6K61_03895 [Nitrospirota bacterium]